MRVLCQIRKVEQTKKEEIRNEIAVGMVRRSFPHHKIYLIRNTTQQQQHKNTTTQQDKKRDCSQHGRSFLSTQKTPFHPAFDSHHCGCSSLVDKTKLAVSGESEY